MAEGVGLTIIRFSFFLSILSTSVGLWCFECTSSEANCTTPVLGLTKNVTCDGVCFAYASNTSVNRGCSNNTTQNCTDGRSCCDTDHCNDFTPTTTPPPIPVECFECTYTKQSDGTQIGHKSCSLDTFDPLHARVTTTLCDYGCAISEIKAEDGDGEEYILARGCAKEGYCGNSCIHVDNYQTCTKCCQGDRCNGGELIAKKPDESNPVNQCYSCTYSKGPSGSVGSPGCYEPFNASGQGVTKVSCSGECSLVIVKDSHSFIVERSCQPGCSPSCTEFGDSKNCRYCCSGSLCNGATIFSSSAHFWVFAVLSLAFLLYG